MSSIANDLISAFNEGYKAGYKSGLSERKTGQWVNGFCSICGKEAVTEWNENGGERLETDFCPFCGADMRGDGEND